jgi:hypothetical protein
MDLALPGHQTLPLGHLNDPAAFYHLLVVFPPSCGCRKLDAAMTVPGSSHFEVIMLTLSLQCSLRDMFNLWEFVLVESRFQLVPVDFIVTVAVSCWNCVYRAGEKSRRDAPRAWFFELFPGSHLFLFLCVLSSVVEGYGG